MYSITLGNERFLHEPGNTRGWPRNRRQLEWALLVVRDGQLPYRAAKMVNFHTRSVPHLLRYLRPFLLHLQEKKNAIAEREFQTGTERVLREISAIAHSDRVSYLRPVYIEERLRFIGIAPHELTPTQRMAVKSWKEVEVTTDDGIEIDYRYRLYEKGEAIALLAKHLGMLSETMLVDMMGRRKAAEITDYSQVSPENLRKAIAGMEELRDKLLTARAIDVDPQSQEE